MKLWTTFLAKGIALALRDRWETNGKEERENDQEAAIDELIVYLSEWLLAIE